MFDAGIASVNIAASGQGVVTSDVVAGNITYGDGTTRFLNATINPVTGVFFTNVSASSYFNLVSGINVATWTVDDAVLNQSFRILEGNATFGKFASASNKTYVVNQKHLLPRVKATISTNRAFQFILDFQSSVVRNISTTNGVVFDRMPANQAQADSDPLNYIQFWFLIQNLQMIGVDDGVTQDTGLRLGATYGSRFENCSWYNFYNGCHIEFGLQNNFENCKFSDCYNINLLLVYGSWPGSSVAASGTNQTTVANSKFRCAPGSQYGVYITGSDGIGLYDIVMEGSSTLPNPVCHIYANNSGGTVVKIMTMRGAHFEQKCTRSNVQIATTGQIYTGILDNSFNQGINNAFAEANTAAGGTVQMWMTNMPENSSNWLLRSNAVGNSTFWNLDKTRLVNKTTPTSPSNWDTTTIGIPGTIPPAASVYQTAAILN